MRFFSAHTLTRINVVKHDVCVKFLSPVKEQPHSIYPKMAAINETNMKICVWTHPMTSYIRTRPMRICIRLGPMRICIWTHNLRLSFSTKKYKKWSELESLTDVATSFMTPIQNTSKIHYNFPCAVGNVVMSLQSDHF